MPKQRKTKPNEVTTFKPQGDPILSIFNDFDNGIMFAKNVLARFYGSTHINLYAKQTWMAVEKSLEVWKAAPEDEEWGRIRWGNHGQQAIEVKDKFEFLDKYITPIIEQGRSIIQEYDQLTDDTRTAIESAQRTLQEIQAPNRPGPPAKVNPAQVAQLRAQGMTQKAIAEQMNVTQQAIAKAEASAVTTNSDNVTISCTPKTTERGNSREYLQRRLKAAAPELLDEIGEGKRFRSVRAAAIEAGIVPQVKTIRISEKTDPQDLAGALVEKLDPDYLKEVVEILREALF